MRWRALLVWLIAPLVSLILSAAEVPFSAHFPQPPETVAAPQLAIVQVSVAALIFPILLPDFASLLLAAAAALPMLMLSALLSATPWPTVAAAEGLIAAWLLALYLWNQVPRSAHGRSILLTIASIFTLAGPVQAYLQAEYAPAGSASWIPSPIEGVLAIFSQNFPLPATISLLLLILSALAITSFRNRHVTVHSP